MGLCERGGLNHLGSTAETLTEHSPSRELHGVLRCTRPDTLHGTITHNWVPHSPTSFPQGNLNSIVYSSYRQDRGLLFWLECVRSVCLNRGLCSGGVGTVWLTLRKGLDRGFIMQISRILPRVRVYSKRLGKAWRHNSGDITRSVDTREGRSRGVYTGSHLHRHLPSPKHFCPLLGMSLRDHLCLTPASISHNEARMGTASFLQSHVYSLADCDLRRRLCGPYFAVLVSDILLLFNTNTGLCCNTSHPTMAT
mmetsp:Transcript_63385/g.167981  ORF Transcript_63385/g.167981 Transcript_63385/m.167981 type:complete len:252 (+) Transcript_63385:291-1046(+)